MTSAEYDAFEKLFCGVKWQSYKDDNAVALLDHSEASPMARTMTLEMTTSMTLTRKGDTIDMDVELLTKTGETYKHGMTLKFNEEQTWKDNEDNPTMIFTIKCCFKDNKFCEIVTPKPPTPGKPNENVFSMENDEMVMVASVPGDDSVVAKRYFKRV